jgi:hypothetical protein
MADRPRDSEWWLASDGKWYPPRLGPGESDASEQRPSRSASDISHTFTIVVAVALSVASVALMGSAYAGIRYATALQKFTGELSEPDRVALEALEITWAGWTGLGLLLLVVTGGLVIGWTFTASKALDARGPIGRRWRGAWTIWGWLIPFANLVIPKLVFNEIEKVSQVPFGSVPVGEEWRENPRFQLGDLWWLLWIGGVIPGQITQVLLGDPERGAGRLAVLVVINAFTYIMFAGAGIALVFLIRRIERSSRARIPGGI